MKKQTHKQWLRSVRRTVIERREGQRGGKTRKRTSSSISVWSWVERWRDYGVDISQLRNGRLVISLPVQMNFSTHYEVTAATILAIRSLTDHRRTSFGGRRLARVEFRNLTRISTSAALVLTAELSKWESLIRRSLRPELAEWNDNILQQFHELGFFSLFEQSPMWLRAPAGVSNANLRLVRYIRGRCGEVEKARELKKGIHQLVGEDIAKWTFLRCGLDEAVTNVTHHAYPEVGGLEETDKPWYMTGSFNNESRQLKIVFYDQGIGIPQSLPASKIWETVLTALSVYEPIDRRRDATMIKAAVEMDRSSTGDEDRGKGLQDLLEFVKQRNDGYLSILSSKGLYKYTMKDGVPSVKSEHFKFPIAGTLIIWSVHLPLEHV